jgi:hypothetical protein
MYIDGSMKIWYSSSKATGGDAGAQRGRNAGALPQTPLKDFALENPSLGV